MTHDPEEDSELDETTRVLSLGRILLLLALIATLLIGIIERLPTIFAWLTLLLE